MSIVATFGDIVQAGPELLSKQQSKLGGDIHTHRLTRVAVMYIVESMTTKSTGTCYSTCTTLWEELGQNFTRVVYFWHLHASYEAFSEESCVPDTFSCPQRLYDFA